MKTLLVLAKQSGLADALGAVLEPEQYRLLPREEIWAAESLLAPGRIDACVLDADLTDIQPIRIIKQIRRQLPDCPIIIFASRRQWEWEEEAYLLGVAHVLAKPVRGRLLKSLFERLWTGGKGRDDVVVMPRAVTESKPAEAIRSPVRALEVLRSFSAILTHTLCSESLLKQFLLLLREIIGVNRAAIFLRKPSLGVGGGAAEDCRLRAACALGLQSSLLDYFELSLTAGIGRYLYRSGRILKNGSDEARSDLEIQKEFELLGAQVAIPILDRESLVGVAVFDGRLTGEFFANEELALIFHLLEEMGLAIKNSWLHDQLLTSNQMMSDLLNQLGSGCVVIGRDLTILHCNPAARACFLGAPRSHETVEFSDLPQFLGSRVFALLHEGEVPAPFKYRKPDTNTVHRITLTPFQCQTALTANAVLLVIEDITQQEQMHQAEVETSNLRLLKSLGQRLAHEIGNALVPISTCQQLLEERHADPEFRGSMVKSMGEGVQRISRLTSQMYFLAQDGLRSADAISIQQLIESAFAQAREQLPGHTPHLNLENRAPGGLVKGDADGLRHALSEVLLNALQAGDPGQTVQVRSYSEADDTGMRWLHIEVRDSGAGFSNEAAQRAGETLPSDRATGVCLGLTVTRKIVEAHHGRVEIQAPEAGGHSRVRISLPLAEPGADMGTNGKRANQEP